MNWNFSTFPVVTPFTFLFHAYKPFERNESTGNYIQYLNLNGWLLQIDFYRKKISTVWLTTELNFWPNFSFAKMSQRNVVINNLRRLIILFKWKSYSELFIQIAYVQMLSLRHFLWYLSFFSIYNQNHKIQLCIASWQSINGFSTIDRNKTWINKKSVWPFVHFCWIQSEQNECILNVSHNRHVMRAFEFESNFQFSRTKTINYYSSHCVQMLTISRGIERKECIPKVTTSNLMFAYQITHLIYMKVSLK